MKTRMTKEVPAQLYMDSSNHTYSWSTVICQKPQILLIDSDSWILIW